MLCKAVSRSRSSPSSEVNFRVKKKLKLSKHEIDQLRELLYDRDAQWAALARYTRKHDRWFEVLQTRE